MESGLVGLRAELQKKKDEASRHPPGHRGVAGKKEAIQPKSFSSSNSGVTGRAAKDEEQRQAEQRTEENARQALERKAAMYDKLHQGVQVLEDDCLNQRFLVNFQKKIVDDVMERKQTREEKEKARKEKQKKHEEANPETYKAESEDQEWVEYTDAFGRTRECLRSELPQRLEQDRQLSQDINPQEKDAEEEASLDSRLLENLHRETRRQKWEAEEVFNATKKDLHYQDVLYDEARTHGPGFLKFSRDEKERKAQMDLLRDLRTETQRAKVTTATSAAKKQKAMKARLEKVRQRKRLKMGLPMKDDDKLKTPPVSEDEEVDEKTVELTPTPPSPPLRKKASTVREWDLGKEGVSSSLTQEEWVLRQRSQRSQEFAPPSSYQPRRGKKKEVMSSSQTQFSEREQREDSPPDPKEQFRAERYPEFAPPPTHEYYGPTITKNRKHQRGTASDVEAAISKGLAHLRKMSDL